jgi:hypothetical protein
MTLKKMAIPSHFKGMLDPVIIEYPLSKLLEV